MLKPDLAATGDAATVEVVTRAQMIAGRPGRVLDRLVALRGETGHFGTLIVTGHDWDRPELWKTSMRLMAEEVMPRLNAHATTSAAA